MHKILYPTPSYRLDIQLLFLKGAILVGVFLFAAYELGGILLSIIVAIFLLPVALILFYYLQSSLCRKIILGDNMLENEWEVVIPHLIPRSQKRIPLKSIGSYQYTDLSQKMSDIIFRHVLFQREEILELYSEKGEKLVEINLTGFAKKEREMLINYLEKKNIRKKGVDKL